MALTEVNSLGIKDLEVKTADIAADAVTNAMIGDDQIDSEHYVDGSIDHQHLANDCIDGDNIQDDVVNSEHIAAGAIDLEHMSSESVDEDNLHISNAGSNGQFLSKQSGNAGGLTWASISSTPEGTAILSTGESGGTKFLREDGDGSCSWQTVSPAITTTSGTDNFTVADGDLIIGTSGHGISFSATADSSGTMDNELFDDYEEGSCNDVHIEFGSTDAGTVNNQSQGRYVKIGTLVWCSGYLKMDMTSPQPSGGAKLCDLPYSVHEFGQPHNWVSIGHFTSNGKCTDSNVILMIGNSGGSKVHLGHDDGSDVHYLTNTSFGTGQWLHCQYDLIYRTTA